MVASDMALEIIADVTTVWLLSTKASFQRPSKTALARWSRSLPAHAFQVGNLPRVLTTSFQIHLHARHH